MDNPETLALAHLSNLHHLVIQLAPSPPPVDDKTLESLKSTLVSWVTPGGGNPDAKPTSQQRYLYFEPWWMQESTRQGFI